MGVIHHVAKSTPWVDRSGFSTAEISGSVQGTTGNQAHRHATRRENTALHFELDSYHSGRSEWSDWYGLTAQAINMANANTIDSQEIISFAAGLNGTIN